MDINSVSSHEKETKYQSTIKQLRQETITKKDNIFI